MTRRLSHTWRVPASVVLTSLGLLFAAPAIAHDLQAKLNAKQANLEHQRNRARVLTSTISRYTGQISALASEITTLRDRISVVGATLSRKEAELRRDRAELNALRRQLQRALRALSERLVAIYESSQPDVVSVILNSDGFDDLLTRYEYLRRIEANDTSIATRVRELRDQTQATVERVAVERNAIARRKAELVRSRAAVQLRAASLQSAQARQRSALRDVRSQTVDLDRDIKRIQARIASQIQAAQTASASSAPTFPTGPTPGQSGAGLIWPINGPITSPFGPRWGSFHPGLDIGDPTGTPIRAAASGTVVFAKPYGGYGNYTCIDHGGGLSTCYAHQSSFAVTSGSVSQGEVIGYVGSTGFSTGPHLHFEVRVNGQPVDPLGYLS